jgi:(2Fe-2S) ferredoxin
MKQDQDYFDFHLLICTNERATGDNCCAKGAGKLIEELKPWLKDELQKAGKTGKGRINKSGCLGRCSEGIACVAYPSGEWFTDVKVDDVEKLKDWIRAKISSGY